MSKVFDLHDWILTPKQAIDLQKQLKSQINIAPSVTQTRYLAGIDCAYDIKKNLCYAVCVLWDQATQQCLEIQKHISEVTFPYIPGLLSFREAPTMIAAYEKLTLEPDAILIDGHGIAHPRGLGIASHIGLWLNKPTVGVAKSRLIGFYSEPGLERGAKSKLEYHKQLIGYVLRSKNRVRPLFISPGHLIDFESACELVLASGQGYRLPEPTRLADQCVGKIKYDHNKEKSCL